MICFNSNICAKRHKTLQCFIPELCIFPHLKITSNKRMCNCSPYFLRFEVIPIAWALSTHHTDVRVLGWGLDIQLQLTKSLFIKVRIILLFPLTPKHNSISAAQPALNHIAWFFWVEPPGNIG